MQSKVALVTGCSSGIGRELALQLSQAGWHVYAGARRPQTLTGLNERITPLELDVNKPSHLRHGVSVIEKQFGKLDLLVNNAGYGAMGPLVEMPLEEVRRQFETNVFAPLALIQHCFPLLQASGNGKVVNIGSVSGILTTPFSGAYCATKSALHSLSDALRMELAPFNVDIITIQPGAIESEFGNNAASTLANTLPEDSLYNPVRNFIEKRATASQKNPTPTGDFVQEVIKAINQKQPPAVQKIGNGSLTLSLLKRLLPDRLLDSILSRSFGLKNLGKKL